jgi:IS30 family transposase
MSYHHLTISERECILLMNHSKESITQISQVLGRNKGTISRELSRNSEGNSYSAHGAQNSYTTRRLACKPQLKVMKPENLAHIVSGLEQYWSPEQIIGHHGMRLCTATIYRALKSGLIPIVLQEKLRQHGKSCKAKGEEQRGTIPDCVSIEERPAEADTRCRIGDWEGDTVAGKWQTGCFMTLVDRKTRVLLARKLDNHRAETLKKSICSSLSGLPCNTLTVDNGKEFAAHIAITAELKAQVFFAHPHSPWERPTNENTNGLLRQFFPKYKSFLTVTQEDLDHAIHLLNNRPRKCLDWKTPYQALAEELLHLD